jgi:hypothetical protein
LPFIKHGCDDLLGDAVFEILIPEGVNSSIGRRVPREIKFGTRLVIRSRLPCACRGGSTVVSVGELIDLFYNQSRGACTPPRDVCP